MDDAYSSYHGRVHDPFLTISPDSSSKGTAQMTAAYSGHMVIEKPLELQEYKESLDRLCFFKDSDD